jgi:hypothetical protein
MWQPAQAGRLMPASSVDKNTRLSSPTIADGAFVMAPNGYSVTMIVDGIETAIVPGTYNGDIGPHID